jgi:uncharacterized protein (DUF2141 family)
VIAGGLAVAALGGAAPVPADTLSLTNQVTNLRSQKGVIRICLTRDAKDFPDCRDGANAIKRSIAATAPSVRIDGLAAGGYAIAIIPDENGNAKLDTFAGIPKEGFGFSRNPRIGFGPPRFASARFELSESGGTQQVRVRYLL